ncbi:MAG: alpha/beta hydrolase-fold protein [Planctomycetota bacterium]
MLSLALVALVSLLSPQDPSPGFVVRLPAELVTESLDGRLLVMLSTDDKDEPRMQVVDGVASAQVFGIDVDDFAPGSTQRVADDAFGYPLRRLRDLPAGHYRMQALLHRYETFRRGDGHVVKLPMDRGEGQQWNKAPGNLLSTPRWIDFDPRAARPIEVAFDHAIPPIEPPQDTAWIKHVRITSPKLSAFWGRPMELGACVLLPKGFSEHPDARYPLVVYHGHFPATFGGFREVPPDPDLKPDYSERFGLAGYNKIQQEQAHEFFRAWNSDDFPRFVVIEIQHANPYYDDSYAVNSANLGPYGDAIQDELIPFVEKRFRCIGEGWARFTYGGSTGGWEALAAQVFWPDSYNGCFASCPDPIDFRAYCLVNVYADANAYFDIGPFQKVARPGHRNWLGQVQSTLFSMNQRELALGTHGRSGQQWDIWEAVFSPCGADGYPQRIWDKETGVIDRAVAEHWREHYDLCHILRRDWKTLGQKLVGKIHIYVGDMDNYYLNDAVYLAEEFLESTKDPYYAGQVDYGDRAEHCWNGDHTRPNAISRLRYHQMYVEMMLARMQATAPRGADLRSWRY